MHTHTDVTFPKIQNKLKKISVVKTLRAGRVHFRELNFFEKVVDFQIFCAYTKVVWLDVFVFTFYLIIRIW